MTNRTAAAVQWYAGQTYGAGMWRRLGAGVLAVPFALRAVVSRRPQRGLLALPVAGVATLLTVALAQLMLINLAFPFRPYLGLGTMDGSIWASTYHGSWGGPTLAGAWAVHAGGMMLLVFPPVAWAIRGLVRLQGRITDAVRVPAQASGRTGTLRRRRPARTSAPTAGRSASPAAVHHRRSPWRGVSVVGAATSVSYVFAHIAHRRGIGDNVLWLPHNPRDAVALAVVLAPLVTAAVLMRGPLNRATAGPVAWPGNPPR